MAKGKLNDRDARCPFFHSHTGNTISCEGFADHSIEQLNFLPPGSKKLHFLMLCSDSYQKCPRYPRLMEKYKED